jgi:formylglycine-generating enzyme required for sulfatase activity
MIRFLFLVLGCFYTPGLISQSVSHVITFREGQNMVIEYVLQTSTPQEILLYCSTDGGKTFSKSLQKVSGDVGKEITAGQKRIVWNVLEEVPEFSGESIVFMVEIAEGLIGDAKNGRPPMEWVAIPAGTFIMGSPDSETGREKDEGPQHQVKLNEFKMSKYEVTFSQYDAFCSATGRSKPLGEGWGRRNRPVINVDWTDAIAFAQWMGCRLPTEAEWEYACRAGSTTPFNTGFSLRTKQANFNLKMKRTKRVGSFPPNAWGLFDMHGNVWEWCNDFKSEYTQNSKINPKVDSGAVRIIRGGSWYDDEGYCRSAKRDCHSSEFRSNLIGFRLVAQNE